MENQLHKQPPAPEEKTGKRKGLSLYQVDRYLRFTLFLVAIALVYIWNSHRAEKQVRMVQSLENEVRELKSDYSNLGAELSYSTRRSVLEERVDSLQLVKMDKPPYLLK